MKLYALKSKKSGRYFKWVEYCDDGYGKYEDEITTITNDDLPTFFNEVQMATSARKENFCPWNELNHHTMDEVEVVAFELVAK